MPQALHNTSSSQAARTALLMANLYCSGRQQSNSCSVALKQMLDLASDQIRIKLNPDERKIARLCYRYCDASRIYAETAWLAEMCRAQVAARTFANHESLSEEARQLCLAEVYPAEAHVEMQQENWQPALALVQDSLHTDLLLEDHYGHTMKVAHRLYMATASATAHFFAGSTQDAVHRLARLLLLLSGEAMQLDEPGDWSQQRIDRLPLGMREFHAMQAVHTLYMLLATLTQAEREAHLQEVFDQLNGNLLSGIGDTNPELGRLDAAAYMGLLKLSLDDPERFLAQLPAALEQGSSQRMRFLVLLDAAFSAIASGWEAREFSALLREFEKDIADTVKFLPVENRLRARIRSVAESALKDAVRAEERVTVAV